MMVSEGRSDEDGVGQRERGRRKVVVGDGQRQRAGGMKTVKDRERGREGRSCGRGAEKE